MKKEFWLERWERAEIGFHQDEINPYLRRFWPGVQAARGGEVFVPLCGKSLDMVWLHEQGSFVLGVELSAIAVQDFFREQGQSPVRVSGGGFDNYLADGICLACGDFFDLRKEDMAQVGAVYDRASLVALPPEMRARYARHLVSILPRGTRILLVTFDYPQAEMAGPPFAVSVQEVESLYSPYAEIRLLAQEDALAQNPRFKQRGVSRMTENIFLLTLR
ncbi:MAG: thiopurine S-methyltransferase [Gallionellaceae bacterium]|nr:MAG: thiopurine S-methyltransferase [Gallionellaceae bacterium]